MEFGECVRGVDWRLACTGEWHKVKEKEKTLALLLTKVVSLCVKQN